ncbi:MAG TPA: hypothetical protein VFX24_06910 [Ktedonobacterales bacterium]|nr:hypothetical protein [Ktedonobacterales bacterium]
MKITANVLRILVSAIGAVMIVLGLLFWTGNAFALLPLHMLLGIALVLMLWIIAVLALVARVNPILALVTLIWGLIVPILGITQFQLLPGSLHWIIQTLHLLVGLVAIALANILARQIAQASATRRTGTLVA